MPKVRKEQWYTFPLDFSPFFSCILVHFHFGIYSLGLLCDVVSGNTSHDGHGALGTFNPLYFKAGYFNDASLIRPSNIIDVHPTLQLLPRDNVLLTLGSDVLWRYTTHDGVYGPPGNLELPARGDSRYIATTA